MAESLFWYKVYCWLFAIANLSLFTTVGGHRAASNTTFEAPFKKYSWKFPEQNDVISIHEGDIPKVAKEFPHFLLYIFSPQTTFGQQRLYEIEKFSRRMKKELHPIPIVVMANPQYLNKLNMEYRIRTNGNYVYYKHGTPIPYQGRPGVLQELQEWMWWIRWPNSEPITSPHNLKKFMKLSLVSVVYFGDKKTEDGYQNYTHIFSKYHHNHMKFGHTFKWELKKHLAAKLPCIQIHTHMNSYTLTNQTHLVCKDLSYERLDEAFAAYKPKVHQVFHPKMVRSWFTFSVVEIFAFFHHGLATEDEKHTHVVFHQFLEHNRLENIGEIDMRRKSGVRLADRFKLDRHIHLPGIFILRQSEKGQVSKYQLTIPAGEELTVNHLIEFQKNFQDKTLKPFFKSEPLSELPVYGGNVVAFNSQTFEEAWHMPKEAGSESEPRYLLVYMTKLTCPYHADTVKSLTFLSEVREVNQLFKIGVMNLARNEHDHNLPSGINVLLLDRMEPKQTPLVLPGDSEIALIDLIHFIQPLVPSLDSQELINTPDL
jgi:hypothetical protein